MSERMSDDEFEGRVVSEGTWRRTCGGATAETLLAIEARRARSEEIRLRALTRCPCGNPGGVVQCDACRERGQQESESRRREADAIALVPLESELHAANDRILALEVRLRAIARAGKHLALATPDKVLRSELERAVKLANEFLPKDGGA